MQSANVLIRATATAVGVMAVAVAICGCSRKVSGSAEVSAPEVTAAARPGRIDGMVPAALRHAVIFKMSGDYADNVPVALSPNGQLLSYPAPSDLSEGSLPVRLCDGWWLDRTGVSTATVFTRWSYSEYMALPQAPTPAELLESVIPGARVTEVETIDMPVRAAAADTAAVNAIIRERTATVRLDG